MIRDALVKWWRPIRGIFCVARDIDGWPTNNKVMFLSKLFKRKSTKLVALLGAFSMMLGVGTTLSAAIVAGETDTVETKAETWPNKPTFFFVPSDNWQADNPHFKVACKNGGAHQGDIWAETPCGSINGKNVYKFTVTENWWISRIQIMRMDPNDHSRQWNYSGEIYLHDSYASGYNCLFMKSTFATYDNWSTNSDVFWRNGIDVIKLTGDQSAGGSNARVFFYNSGSAWASGGDCALRAWGGSATPAAIDAALSTPATIYYLEWFCDSDGKTWYGYADVPTDITAFQFVLMNTTHASDATVSYYQEGTIIGGVWTAGGTFPKDSTYFSYIYYAAGNSNTKIGVTQKRPDANTLGAVFMAKLVESVNTCSANAYNGYGAYAQLNTGFYANATATAKASTCTSLGGQSMTVTDHFNGMSARASGTGAAGIIPGPSANQSPLTTTLWIVLGAGLAGLAAIGTAYFVSKKKKRHQA